jgi:hypothetical protein
MAAAVLDGLTTLFGCVTAIAIAAFAVTLMIGLVRVFATVIRVGPAGSSQVRRVNYLWFRRLQHVFWVMYIPGLIYAILNGLRGS